MVDSNYGEMSSGQRKGRELDGKDVFLVIPVEKRRLKTH
jgi:hypothetical protein